MANKLCPLRKQTAIDQTIIGDVAVRVKEAVFGECYGEKCAWWVNPVDSEPYCVIQELTYLATIADFIFELKEKSQIEET